MRCRRAPRAGLGTARTTKEESTWGADVKYQLGAFALLAASMAASAQSSVTLYGRADGGVEYLNHIANGTGGNASRWSAEGGDWGTSMLGFKGTEDLGGGNSALFDLETALQLMNGTTGGGKMFSRRAYVGLKNETWGQLQAGRNLFIDSDGVWEFDPFVQQAVSAASLVRGRNWQQTSNNFEYHSPVWHGLDAQGQYAFGNQTSGFNNGAQGDFGRSDGIMRSVEHTSELQSHHDLVCRLLLEKKKKNIIVTMHEIKTILIRKQSRISSLK